jgi:hypothetical protein
MSRSFLLSLVIALVGFTPAEVRAAPPPLLPDLRMARIPTDAGNLKVDIETQPGRRLLRFTAIIVNGGDGPFEALGRRPSPAATTMKAKQRVLDSQGRWREIYTPAVMYYAGDGHDHWHLRDLARYELKSLDRNAIVGRGVKRGFCFSDNLPATPDAPAGPRSYPNCGPGDPTLLTVTMGLSVGWVDIYGADLGFQWVDVTGLSDGRYRLTATADATNWFREKSDSNNAAWIDFRLEGTTIRDVVQGPGA